MSLGKNCYLLEKNFSPEELSKLRNALIREAEEARGCIRVGSRKPFVSKNKKFEDVLESKDSIATILSAGPTFIADSTNTTDNSTEITEFAFQKEFEDFKFFENKTSAEILEEIIGSPEKEFLFNGNLSQILFKGFNTSNLLVNLEDGEEQSIETNGPIKLPDLEQFPQPEKLTELKKLNLPTTPHKLNLQKLTTTPHNNLENGETDVFDDVGNNKEAIRKITTIVNKLNVELTTEASIKKKIHATIKPKPLAFIAPLDHEINSEKKQTITNGKRFGGINVTPESRFKLNTIKNTTPLFNSRTKFSTTPPTRTTQSTVLTTIKSTQTPTPKTPLTSTTTKKYTKFPNRQFGVLNRNFNSGPSSCFIDILFVVDSSGSVQKVYNQQKEYLNEILERINLDSGSQRVALLQFAGAETQKTEWMYDTFETKEQIMNAFSQVRHITGTTHIGAALKNALTILNFRRPNALSIVVLLSDGFSQDDALQPAEALRNLNNLEFLALSISNLSNLDYLSAITGSADRVFVGDSEAGELHKYLDDRLRCQTGNRRG